MLFRHRAADPGRSLDHHEVDVIDQCGAHVDLGQIAAGQQNANERAHREHAEHRQRAPDRPDQRRAACARPHQRHQQGRARRVVVDHGIEQAERAPAHAAQHSLGVGHGAPLPHRPARATAAVQEIVGDQQAQRHHRLDAGQPLDQPRVRSGAPQHPGNQRRQRHARNHRLRCVLVVAQQEPGTPLGRILRVRPEGTRLGRCSSGRFGRARHQGRRQQERGTFERYRQCVARLKLPCVFRRAFSAPAAGACRAPTAGGPGSRSRRARRSCAAAARHCAAHARSPDRPARGGG